jgi:hypothetical protein
MLSLCLLIGGLTRSVDAVERFVQSVPSTSSITQTCENYGRIADLAASLRDKGISSGHVVDYLIKQSREVPVLPGTTREGRARFENKLTTIVLVVYAHPELTPGAAKLATYQECLNSP